MMDVIEGPKSRFHSFVYFYQGTTLDEMERQALQTCSDPMPSDICARLKLPAGSTYAQADEHIMAAGRSKIYADFLKAFKKRQHTK